MREFAEIAWEERLLNVAGDVDLLFEALALAFALDEAGVVQNAGGLICKGVEQLTIELGKGGGAPGI